MRVKTYYGAGFHGAAVGRMRYSQDFLTKWLIARAQFERWANVLAENDDAPAASDLLLRTQEIPAVNWLSLY